MLQCLLGLLQYLRHLIHPRYSKPISMIFNVARLRSRYLYTVECSLPDSIMSTAVRPMGSWTEFPMMATVSPYTERSTPRHVLDYPPGLFPGADDPGPHALQLVMAFADVIVNVHHLQVLILPEKPERPFRDKPRPMALMMSIDLQGQDRGPLTFILDENLALGVDPDGHLHPFLEHPLAGSVLPDQAPTLSFGIRTAFISSSPPVLT